MMLSIGLFFVGEQVVAGPDQEGVKPRKGSAGFGVTVADTHCRVLIAQVNLEVGDLHLSETGDGFVGDYSLEVPLRSSKNEQGTMHLTFNQPLSEYFKDGGVLEGTGMSPQKPGQERSIVCTVIPDDQEGGKGALLLDIDTGKRVMHFKTTYAMFGNIPLLAMADQKNH